jgi:hypothetical protein
MDAKHHCVSEGKGEAGEVLQKPMGKIVALACDKNDQGPGVSVRIDANHANWPRYVGVTFGSMRLQKTVALGGVFGVLSTAPQHVGLAALGSYAEL